MIILTGITGNAKAEIQRVEAKFISLEFNDLNSQYMPRPTFANTIAPPGTSFFILEFEMPNYGNKTSKFGVGIEFVDENIDVINKFLSWASMAKDRGDIFDKEIATVKGYDVGPFYQWNDYEFHSGNKNSHYLLITQKTKMLGFFTKDHQAGDSFVLDEENAKLLIDRLNEFKARKVTKTNTDDYK